MALRRGVVYILTHVFWIWAQRGWMRRAYTGCLKWVAQGGRNLDAWLQKKTRDTYVFSAWRSCPRTLYTRPRRRDAPSSKFLQRFGSHGVATQGWHAQAPHLRGALSPMPCTHACTHGERRPYSRVCRAHGEHRPYTCACRAMGRGKAAAAATPHSDVKAPLKHAWNTHSRSCNALSAAAMERRPQRYSPAIQ